MAGLEVTPESPSCSISFSRPPLRRKSRDRKSSQTDWPRSRNSSRGFLIMAPPQGDLRFGRFDNVLRGEAEFLHQIVDRRRGAESAHPNGSTARPHIPVPSQGRGGLDSDPGLHPRGQHLIPTGLALTLEQLP